MLFILVLSFLCAQIYTKPLQATVKSTDNDISYINQPNDGSGNYYFIYKTADGSFREELGEFRNGTMVVTGSYAYKSPDGKTIQVTYRADEEGYRVIPINETATDDRFNTPMEPIDPSLLCSLLGRCTEEASVGNVNPEASV